MRRKCNFSIFFVWFFVVGLWMETAVAQEETAVAQEETAVAQEETAVAQEETAVAQEQGEDSDQVELSLGGFPVRARGLVVPDVAGIRVGMSLKKAMYKLRKYNKNLFYREMTSGSFSAGINGKAVITAVVAQDGDHELPSRKGCRDGEIWKRFRKKSTRVCWDSVHESIYVFVGGLPGREYVVGVYMDRYYVRDDGKWLNFSPTDDAPGAGAARDALVVKYGYPTAYSEYNNYFEMGYLYDSIGEYASLAGEMFSLESFDSNPDPNCFPKMIFYGSGGVRYSYRMGEDCGLAVRVKGIVRPDLGKSLFRESQILSVSVFVLDHVKLNKSIRERLAAIEKSDGRRRVRRKRRNDF